MLYNPVSTYRIQFHKDFTFSAFEKIIPYLQKIGIKTIYASPIFKAVPGSNHGYDGTDPHVINPEIGTIKQLKNIEIKLNEAGIGWLQDIVPNHMAYQHDNAWLMDVLENGPQSRFSTYFDIDWNHKKFDGKIMAPFLGATLDKTVEKGDLKLIRQNGKIFLNYFDLNFPINRASTDQLLVPDDQDGLDKINSDHPVLRTIIDKQYYRLCHWQQSDTEINYRRFFTVNGLICLNTQDRNVFEDYHQSIFSLVDKEFFRGLRVDHVDGLYDPTAYLEQLITSTNERTYITVEKILQQNEPLPAQWKIAGSTGYDFLASVNNLFTNKRNEAHFTELYEDFIGDYNSQEDESPKKKSQILYRYMHGELDNLYELLLSFTDRKLISSIYPSDLKSAIAEFLIECPVYRFYGNKFPLQDDEAQAIGNILANVKRNGIAKWHAVEVLEKLFFKKPYEGNHDYNNKLSHFYQRCMQLTGPLMAKGVEDTLMYSYSRFVAHNEVGDHPGSFGTTPFEFHQAMIRRQQQWHLTQNATSTHDTKKGEDIRARLNVISDIPGEWAEMVQYWQQLNATIKQENNPDANDEYDMYQMLLGSYPMPGMPDQDFVQRFSDYLQKSLREEKINSDWENPNEAYEQTTISFARNLLDKEKEFWKSFSAFHQRVVDFGIMNSLGQLILKLVCPGVPDIYQGTELWDLNFVDPDNRRPVDYQTRAQWLNEILNEREQEGFISRLWENRYNGKIKLWLTHELLELRRQQPDFFSHAEYIPLQVKGTYSDFVFAFARKYKQECIILAIPLHLAELCGQQQTGILNVDWKDTRITLPKNLRVKAQDVLIHSEKQLGNEINLNHFSKSLSLCILKLHSTDSGRCAGILLHSTSLSSKFGIGDFGPEAFAFAEALSNCNQTIWQMLPLNPVDSAQGYSPYSSISSCAGNTLLISPEFLVRDGLLSDKDLEQLQLPQLARIDFDAVIRNRDEMFRKVWANIKKSKKNILRKSFEDFCIKENYWLDDYAKYVVIKNQQDGKPWFQWPAELRMRDKTSLERFADEHKDEIKKTKFLQFIFNKQWRELKEFCNGKGLQLMGDLPIYVSYDSADTWANAKMFNLDEEGKLVGVAGTPPDAFSDTGQLWGMPVFKWDVLKENNYKWWIERFRRNKELFDLIRLDHFRAFIAYWEVPAGHTTASKGSWKQGPGADFFNSVKEQLGELPFIAEDLGEINEDVTTLREEFNFPGMKVLQFAFDENMPDSEYIPHNFGHNFIVYTGTHDNNTTRGWFRQNIDEATKKRVSQYCGNNISENTITYELIQLAYSSISKMVIVPMQDLLNLDEHARMNIPSATENNWRWRLLPGQFNNDVQNKLRELVWLYKRK